MGKKLSYGAIRALGVSCIVSVAALTGFTVKMAVDDANDRADASYKSAMSGVQKDSDDPVTTDVTVTTTDVSVTTTEANTTTTTTTETAEVTTEVTTETVEPSTESTVETTDPVVTEPDESTTEPEVDGGSEAQLPDDQDTNGVNKTPDLGYDLTNVVINEDGSIAYVIQPGDCLSRIGARYGYSVGQLAAANPYITNVNLIYSGNQVILPCDEAFATYVAEYK